MSGLNNLKNILSYSFSNDDIKFYLGSDTKIIEYKELKKFNSIDELLPKERDFVVILVETKQNSGHWTTLMKYDGILEWFDSYGLDVDEELKFVSFFYKNMLGENKKLLTNLIDTSDYDCIYNNKKLQTDKDFDDTCGRWITSRLLHFKKGENLKQYIDFLDNYIYLHKLKGLFKYDLLVIKEVPKPS